MSLTVRPASRSSAKPLIGFYDRSGTGKTLSALFLARGFVGREGRIAMVESESGRGEAHLDTVVGESYVGGFDVVSIWDHDDGCPMHSKARAAGECNCTHRGKPFSPKRYSAAIAAIEAGRYDAMIVDSASHEWEGLGGVLDMAATNQNNGKTGQQVWQEPKIDHSKYFMLRLMQTSVPLVIVNMRAKYPMEEVTIKGKKVWQRSTELEPKQSEDVLFEMFVHGHFDSEHRFHGTKYTKSELAQVIPSGEVITNATGEALARWASGRVAEQKAADVSDDAALALVVAAMLDAKTIDALRLVGTGSAVASLGASDKAAAKVAYRDRLNALQGAPEPGTNG